MESSLTAIKESTQTHAQLKSLFKTAESASKNEFLKIYSELPSQVRSRIWLARKSDHGDTLVHIGARLGLSWLVDLAVAENADLVLPSHHNKQPLHDAAQTGAVECVQTLLRSNRIPVDPLKRADWTPLMLACTASEHKGDERTELLTTLRYRFTDCVNLLLQYGADPSFTNKDGWNCLHIAAHAGSPSIVSLLLQHSPNLVLERTSNGRTVLHCLACTPSTSPSDVFAVAQILLERAPSLRYLCDACGTLPLFDALRRGLVSLVDLLLQLDAVNQLTARDSLGLQAAHLCAETGQLECLKLVVSHLGLSSLSSQVPSGYPGGLTGTCPLHLACRSGQYQIVNYIVDLWTDNPNIDYSITDWLLPLDSSGRSPFHYAIFGTAGCGAVHKKHRLLCMELISDCLINNISDNQKSLKLFHEHLTSLLEVEPLDSEMQCLLKSRLEKTTNKFSVASEC